MNYLFGEQLLHVSLIRDVGIRSQTELLLATRHEDEGSTKQPGRRTTNNVGNSGLPYPSGSIK